MLVITTITPHPMTPLMASSSSCSSSSSSWFRGGSVGICRVSRLCVLLLLSVFVCFASVPVFVSGQVQVACQLQVPANPMTAAGLATPWILSGAGCSQANPNTMTFVQGAILNPGTGAITIYDPLVVDANTAPLVAPVVPTTLTTNDVVAFWVQTQADSIQLIGPGSANCVSGLTNPPSLFGKFAFCNALQFFNFAKQAIASGNLIPQALGKGSMDGLACPSSRDFSYLGRDSHATVMTTYLLKPATGQTAHDTPANNLQCNGQCVVIQSDSARIMNSVYNILGCALWVRPDLTDANLQQQASALPLNEIQAFFYTAGAPPNTVALVPANDTLAKVNGVPNLQKLNLIRDALNQPEVATLAAADTVQYCTSMTQIPPPRLAADAALLRAFPRPFDVTEAASLYTLVVKRQIQLYTALGCPNVAPIPFTVVPADWNVNSAVALADATPIQPVVLPPLRCENMFIFDTKCSFLIALLVVGGGIVLGFIGLLILRVLQAWKYGDKAKQDSTRAAIRV